MPRLLPLYFKLARPNQWLKNLMLFFPPFLGGKIWHHDNVLIACVAFVSFSLASSAGYAINDILDRSNDQIHPRKKHRPIAAGAIPVIAGQGFVLVCLLAAFLLALYLPIKFVYWLAAYVALSYAYSQILKHQPIFDIFCIALGFVIRLYAGGAAFKIVVSDWLFLSVFLLALFLSAGKRLSEKISLGEDSAQHREILASYPAGVLEGFLVFSGAAVLVTYTLYVINRHQLVYSVPLCCFGLFRYMLLVKSGSEGDPTTVLVKDRPLLLVSVVWFFMVFWATY